MSFIPTDSLREFSSRSGTGYVTEEIWKKAGKCLLLTLVRDAAGSAEVNTDAVALLCRKGGSPAAGKPQDAHIWLLTPPNLGFLKGSAPSVRWGSQGGHDRVPSSPLPVGVPDADDTLPHPDSSVVSPRLLGQVGEAAVFFQKKP